ncbi:MAG: hypothetical protein IJ042_07105, partial [Butyricicoccus sp.]|nr:hypothetical protein [Butyricicoccus sp.]
NCNEAVVNWYWQQRFNGGEWTMIAGATTNTLTVTADEDGWEYRCMMEDDDGDCKYTETAALTLCLTPTEILLETPASGNDHPEVTDNSYTFYESGTAVPKNKEWQEIVFYAAGETTVSLDSLPSGVTITALFWDDEDPVPIACEVSDNSITIACDEMPDEAAGRADGYSSELYVTTSDGEVSLLSIRFISTASEDTAPANTLCWRGIEKCGGNVFEPTGEYSTEPITVHGTNTRRVVFYYGDVMLEPDELTFSEHSGLTVEEIEGENEDGEAFTHFRILSENGVGFTKQTVSYKGQSITIKFEAINEPTGGLCYTLVTAVEDENGDQYYVDGEYRTTEISIPSRDQVDIRIYYDGELIESAKDLDYSNNLRFKAIESDDDIFGCFRVSFRDITIDTVQTFAHADDPDDIINVRPNIPPYGFYTKAEPILANLTEELTIEAGGTGTVYFYDVTNESECSSSLWFDNAPKGVSFGEVKRLANNMISVSVSVADTVAVGEFALMATGYDTAELTITVVTETVLDLRDGSIVLYAEDEDEVEAVQTLTDGTKKYYYASAFIVTSGGEATSNTITVADGTAPLTLHDCQIVNGTAPLIDVDEDAELWLTVSENSVLNVQSSDFAAVHVPDGAEFHYLGGSLEI